MTDRQFKQSLDRWLTREDEWTDDAENEPYYDADEDADDDSGGDLEWAQVLATEAAGEELC